MFSTTEKLVAIKQKFSTYRKAITEEFAVDLIIVFLLAAILFPIAQNQLVSATTTNWNSAVVVMFEVLLPILVIVALVRHFT